MIKFIIAIALLSANLEAHALTLEITNLFGQLATQSGAQGSGNSVDEVLLRLSREINNKMPITVDNNTRLDRVSTEPGRRFIYHYTIIAEAKVGGIPIDFSKELKPQLKNQLCGSTETQKFLKNGVTVSYQYQDSGGREMGGAEFSPSDCGY